MGPEPTLQSAERERPHRCPVCGVPYATQEDEEGCPVCLLRRAMQPEATVQDLRDDGRFDHYEIVRRAAGCFDELGRGAMGVTYRALDTVLGHAVALKVIDARIAGSRDARERFLREARAAARLRHPNIASVFYYGVRNSDGQCFYAMELVEGETLEARMRRERPLSAAFALEVVAQVARAIAAAEIQGLVHRDLKPLNLMLAQGPDLTVKVIDFGLAKAVAASESDITHGAFVETPSSEPAEEASCRFACRDSQVANKTCTEENFRSQIAGYRRRCFWSGGGYRFPGSCMGKQGCQRRYNCCLGWGRKVYAR
jgi:serine/threonine protein kinase